MDPDEPRQAYLHEQGLYFDEEASVDSHVAGIFTEEEEDEICEWLVWERQHPGGTAEKFYAQRNTGPARGNTQLNAATAGPSTTQSEEALEDWRVGGIFTDEDADEIIAWAIWEQQHPGGTAEEFYAQRNTGSAGSNTQLNTATAGPSRDRDEEEDSSNQNADDTAEPDTETLEKMGFVAKGPFTGIQRWIIHQNRRKTPLSIFAVLQAREPAIEFSPVHVETELRKVRARVNRSAWTLEASNIVDENLHLKTKDLHNLLVATVPGFKLSQQDVGYFRTSQLHNRRKRGLYKQRRNASEAQSSTQG